MDKIIVRGARAHNLKNINLEIPKNKLVVFTGVSGSGKSSLAFDTIYAEGQRRYVESLSSYARQFLGIMPKPDVDAIEGLSPSISIDQKSASHNPRSTVGTVTEIYDYLRLLFARVGHPHCPNCGREISRMDKEQILHSIIRTIKELLAKEKGQKPLRVMILAPIVRDRKGEFSQLLDNTHAKGYKQARIDGNIIDLADDLLLIKTNRHSIEVVIDRLSANRKDLTDTVLFSSLTKRLRDSLESSLDMSDGLVILAAVADKTFDFPKKPALMTDHLFSEKLACPVCNIAVSDIEPRLFSFNSPHGACPACKGLGNILMVDPSMVFNPNLSITEGGILPFARQFYHHTWYARLIAAVAKEHGIDPRKTLSHITEKQRALLLRGTGGREYVVEGENRFGRLTQIHEAFPGIIAELEKKYIETASDFAKMEIEKYMRSKVCPECSGRRLKKEALTITINGKSITQLTDMSIKGSFDWLHGLFDNHRLNSRETIIAEPIIKETNKRLEFLLAVGLEYLTISRDATTLAGGEAQRIRLASQIGSGLSGVLYVLDEPSIGLHPRDNHRLIATLKKLRDLGNSILVVEHDREMIENADYIFDFGPGGGKWGGMVTAKGTLVEIKSNNQSLTGKYLSDKRKISNFNPAMAGQISNNMLSISGCSQFNLKNLMVDFPLHTLICVTGVSGSGKSTLIVETLYKALKIHFNPYYKEKPGPFTNLTGIDRIKAVHLIDQTPIGRTPRSNPATYIGAFNYIRALFAQLKESKLRGYGPGRFSFNVAGGRCEQCEGGGEEKIEMQFLPPVWVKCEICKGRRYNNGTLEILFKGKNIADVLDMTTSDALEYFANIPPLFNKLKTLNDVGLDYIHLGQPAPTLSGGEAQRVKLASELSKKGSGGNVYILDEPTTGLHFADLEKLLRVMLELVKAGNTVIVIEHNLEIIKNADYIIDLGPEGGEKGGTLIAFGTPFDIAANPASYTGLFLKKIL